MATSVIGKSFPFGSRSQSTGKSQRERIAAARSVLDEYRFAHLVRVEQKRTQRSGDPFMIALINFGDLANRDLGRGVVESVLEVLRASTREIDTLGWHRAGSVLGIVFAEIGAAEQGTVEAISKRLSKCLREVLDHEVGGEILMSYHVCGKSNNPDVGLGRSLPDANRVVHLTTPSREFGDISEAYCDSN
jgi:hypothetical protein